MDSNRIEQTFESEGYGSGNYSLHNSYRDDVTGDFNDTDDQNNEKSNHFEFNPLSFSFPQGTISNNTPMSFSFPTTIEENDDNTPNTTKNQPKISSKEIEEKTNKKPDKKPCFNFPSTLNDVNNNKKRENETMNSSTEKYPTFSELSFRFPDLPDESSFHNTNKNNNNNNFDFTFDSSSINDNDDGGYNDDGSDNNSMNHHFNSAYNDDVTASEIQEENYSFNFSSNNSDAYVENENFSIQQKKNEEEEEEEIEDYEEENKKLTNTGVVKDIPCTFSPSDFNFEPINQQNNNIQNNNENSIIMDDNDTFDTKKFLSKYYNNNNNNTATNSTSTCSFAFDQLSQQLDKVHDLNQLKEMILNSARGRDNISLISLANEMRREQPLLNPHHRNWNQEYQNLLETPDSVHKFKELAHLAHDFVYAATTYAKIIISEQCLPNSRKTIPPISVGGVAGGQKYLCQNIMFKFALDVEIFPGLYMYGGQYVDHESAMKAAAHELKGLCQYYSTLIEGLSYPLLANIDYKGFRMIAISVLPISKDTLKYGSCDSGVHVKTLDEKLNSLMELTGKCLNLQEHYAGTVLQQGSFIYSCGDLEVHLGTDNRYYVLDFARSFPPESPPRDRKLRNPRAVYYRLLRPEFVRSYEFPLSPDAFTPWGSKDKNYKQYNSIVLLATKKLLNKIIPEFAKRFDEQYETIENKLITEIHRIGINVRHLGQIRNHCKSPSCRDVLKIEMIVRVVKNQLRDLMRSTMRQVKGLSQEPFKAVVIQTFNLVLGRDKEKSKTFWISIQGQLKIKIL